MRRLLISSLAASLVCPTASLGIETQAWKAPTSHIHTVDCFAQFQTVSSTTSCPVTTLLHNSDETVTFVRWSDYSTVVQTITMSWTPGAFNDPCCTRTETFSVDPSQFAASGWREVRWTSNADAPVRAFTTSRECLWIVNGKSRSDNCGGPATAGRCGGGSWYPDAPDNYLIATVDCRDVQKAQAGVYHVGDTFRVRFQGSGNHGEANIDPHFHQGDPGVVLSTSLAGGNAWTTVTIPAVIAPGQHKLHLRSVWANGNAGAYVLPFTTA